MATEPFVIVVTGASSGFGRLTAFALARRGHRVFAGIRGIAARNEAAAREISAQAERERIALFPVELDVTSAASVEAAVEEVVRREGRLDVVVNNAGGMSVGIDEAFTDEQVRALFETNVFGPQRVNRAALPHMRARRSGLLVHVSSNMARITFPFAGLYSATKKALEGLAESYRYQLAPLGIDSTIVEPGGYGTALFSKLGFPADEERVAAYGEVAELPGRIFGGFAEGLKGDGAPDPQEVASAIVQLVETPAGARPLRTVVDRFTAQGVEAINATEREVQEQVFGAFGLEELMRIRG